MKARHPNPDAIYGQSRRRSEIVPPKLRSGAARLHLLAQKPTIRDHEARIALADEGAQSVPVLQHIGHVQDKMIAFPVALHLAGKHAQ